MDALDTNPRLKWLCTALAVAWITTMAMGACLYLDGRETRQAVRVSADRIVASNQTRQAASEAVVTLFSPDVRPGFGR